MKFIYSLRGKYVSTAIMLLCAAIHTNAQTLNAHPNTYVTYNCNGFYDYLPAGYNPSGTQTYPVLIAFGGLSQNGNGSASQLDYVFSNWGGPGWQITNGKFPSSITVNGTLFRFIVILPQFSSTASPTGINTLIDYVLAHYKADASRIYLTGNSSGGGYCWDYPGASVQNGLRIAAVVPTCAAASYNTTKANNIAAANLPVWATHNAVDPTVSPNTTRNFVNGINAAPVPPTPRAKMTIFQDQGHNCADSTFNMTYGIGAYAWMLQYRRGSAPANQPPVANAGSDQTIKLPVNSVQLNGNNSYDPDGTITYGWSKIAGPTQYNLSSTTIVNPVLSNLVAGTYTFRLTVTDNNGAKSIDDINIVVNPAIANQPPVANAGTDVSMTLPTNSVRLDGSKSFDPDGTITYSWSKIAGPTQYTLSSTTVVNPLLSNLLAGTYTFRLTVTDNGGAKSADDIIIIVKAAGVNLPPVADAGPDIIIYLPSNSVTLNGKGTDADGNITTYAWKEMLGPNNSTISAPAKAQTSVGNLIAGRYVFKLTVTDNNGATAWNQMQLTVKGGATKSINVSMYGGSNPYNNVAWNNWNVGNGSSLNLTSPGLKYSDGSVSNIKGVLSSTLTMADNGATYPGGMAPPEVLRYSSYSKTARTLTFTGLSTSSQYSIELYASRLINNAYVTQFAVNNSSVNIATYQNYTNKAIFTNVSPNAQGQIVVNIGTVTGYNYLNGFSLTEQSTIAGVTANSGSVSEANTDNAITSLKVYPNPVTDNFVLQFNHQQQGSMKLQLYNINGSLIKEIIVSQVSSGTTVNVPMRELPQGTYLLKVQAGKWSETRKIIKL
ncbi:MAG: PKD domain-containing protein [Ginsengibacter sp.]